MAWGKKKFAGTMTWEQDVCAISEVSQTLADRAKRKWLTKHIVPLHDGTVLIVSMQSAQYAPKVKKAKKVAPADEAVKE